MEVQVRTATVPDDIDFLTAGKTYSCKINPNGSGNGGTIVADNGETRYIYIPNCAHLNGEPWEIVPEGSE